MIYLKDYLKGLLHYCILSIAIGIVVIMLWDPPHTLCNSEKTQFLETQKSFLSPDPALKKAFKKAKSPHDRLFASCKESENSGGCLEYFLRIKKFVSDYEVTSQDCRKIIYPDNKIKPVFKKSLTLMLNLAWGKAAPSEFKKKYSWFDQADLALFCRIKSMTQKSISESAWETQREGLLQQLPGAENLSREQLWKSSLLSTSCKYFL